MVCKQIEIFFTVLGKAMALRDQYDNARDSKFQTKVAAALTYRAAIEIQTLDPGNPDHVNQLRLAKIVFEANCEDVLFVSAPFASFGLSNNSTDAQIQAAVDNNFALIAKLLDSDL